MKKGAKLVIIEFYFRFQFFAITGLKSNEIALCNTGCLCKNPENGVHNRDSRNRDETTKSKKTI